jgi:predicted RNA binding protein with dsRBD fold (UPF0201 family)
VKVTIRYPVFPTEDVQRAETAVENLLGPLNFTSDEFAERIDLISISESRDQFGYLRQSIHDKRILDAVRVRLLKNLDEFTTYLYFDKQAAVIGKPRLIDNINEEPPLESIEIKFEFKSEVEFEEFLDWFSPRTKDGKVIN